MDFSKRLSFLHALCLNETARNATEVSTNLEDYNPQDAANYLACYLTFMAIKDAQRSPVDERVDNFDMLGVYHAYAMLVYAFLMLPLAAENIAPDTESASVIIAKTLFAGLAEEELVEIIESGSHKFSLIAEAEQEHWATYRQDLDKSVIAFVIAATDEEAPFEKEEVIPMLGALLSMLCEAFASE